MSLKFLTITEAIEDLKSSLQIAKDILRFDLGIMKSLWKTSSMWERVKLVGSLLGQLLIETGVLSLRVFMILVTMVLWLVFFMLRLVRQGSKI